MSSVRFHVSGGQVWALCKCDACGDVHRYLPAAAVTCKRCGYRMPIEGALIQAIESGAIPHLRPVEKIVTD